jgi:DNA gyrase/topoisomerase IV subunit A
MPIIQASLRSHARASWTTYAKYTIEDRALPDVRDGLKPVHRRLIHAANELPNFNSKSKYVKSAKLVGDTMGNYHPHGDKSIYDALVKLAQDFSSNLPLFDGHGNWGDVLGNVAAAMRYTEVRPAEALELMMEGIEKGIVPMVPNYDGTRREPEYLPSVLPNLLINGTIGIASAMNSIFLPHNVDESIRACIRVLDNPYCTISDIMEVLGSPDFPTGGKILNGDDMYEIYSSGKGVVRVSGLYHINKKEIRITNLPYKMTVAQFISNVYELIKKKALPQIRNVTPQGSVVSIIVDTEANVGEVVQILAKRAGLISSFNVNMSALGEGGVLELNLKSLIEQFIAHRVNMVSAEMRYDLAKEKRALARLYAFKFAAEHKQDITRIVLGSKSKKHAEEQLIENFPVLTEEQTEYIVTLQLYRLTEEEVKKTEVEITKTEESVSEIEDTLSDEAKIRQIIKSRLEGFLDDDQIRSTVLASEGTYINRKANVNVEQPKFPQFESQDAYLQISNNTVKIKAQEDSTTVTADYNETLTAIDKFGFTHNIRVGELMQSTGFAVKNEDIDAVYFNAEERQLVITKRGLLGYYEVNTLDRIVCQIPVGITDEIISRTENVEFTHLVLMTDYSRTVIIPKNCIPSYTNRILPMPAIGLEDDEHIVEHHFVNNNIEKYVVLAVNDAGEYYQTFLDDIGTWDMFDTPLTALPFSKTEGIAVSLNKLEKQAELVLSDESTIIIDLRRFVKINRNSEACKYKVKLKPRITVTEVR